MLYQTINFEEETSLLRVSIRYKAGMPFKCGAGICGTCKCSIEEGIENTNDAYQEQLKVKEQEELNRKQNILK